MSDERVFEVLLAELDRDRAHAALFRRLVADYPEQLTIEVVSAALRHGHISATEAITVIREFHLGFRRTLTELALLGERRGWRARDLVVEALEGQPH